MSLMNNSETCVGYGQFSSSSRLIVSSLCAEVEEQRCLISHVLVVSAERALDT